MRLGRFFLSSTMLVCATGSQLLAAENLSPDPQNGQGSHPARMLPPGMSMMPLMRGSQPVEVEMLPVVLRGEGMDAATMTRWVKLAADGFHVAAVVGDPAHQVLILERQMAGSGDNYRLPNSVVQDASLSASLKDTIQGILEARQPKRIPVAPGQPQPQVIPGQIAPAGPVPMPQSK